MGNGLKITCKESSFLISKRQETRLSFGEKVQLNLHLAVCGTCNLFKKQTDYITSLLKKNVTPEDATLNPVVKQRMHDELNKEME